MEDSNFDVDVFISYAHIDNQPPFEDENGWVDRFHEMLEKRLAEYLGKSPQIWRDPKLRGNDFFDDEIRDNIIHAAALICIISPRYLKSEYCQKELKIFLETVNRDGRFRVDNKSRLFKVIKTHVPYTEHPAPIRQLLGYEFFQIDKDKGVPRELRFYKIEDDEVKRKYLYKIDDIAFHLKELLLMMTKGELGENGKNAQLLEASKKVYLAESTTDLKEEHETIRRELERQGHQVFPIENLPIVYTELYEHVEKYFDECDFSIHLLGKNYGFIPEGGNLSVGEIQLDIARKKAEKGSYHPIVWMPENLLEQEVEPRQQKFIESISTNTDFLREADLIKSPLGKLKTVIDERLTVSTKIEIQDLDSDGPQLVYLICNQRDLNETKQIEDYLFNQGLEVVKPIFEGAPTEQLEAHKENLRFCDAVLIYCGNANITWVKQKLQSLKKISGYGRKKPINSKYLYFAPPATQNKADFQTHHKVEIISGMEGWNPEQLKSFIEQVKSSDG